MRRGSFSLLFIFASHVFATGVQSLTTLPNALANAVQLDASGNIYVAGFFIANPQDPNAPAHAFAAKLSPDASQIIWWTQLAGSKDDRATALALGADNSVYITGTTNSPDFPTTPGAMQTSPIAVGSAFAAKLNPNGAVVYSTYIAASTGQSIAVDAAGHAFITGSQGANLGFQPTPGAVVGATSTQFNTAYIIELDPTGSSAVLAIQGFGGNQIALDEQGNIYAVGAFIGPLAPTTPGAFQSTVPRLVCIGAGFFGDFYCTYQHIAKIDPTGTKLIFATYLSGMWGANPSGLAVDGSGNAIVAGTTSSPDYPTTPGAYQVEYFPDPAQEIAALDFSAPPSTGYITKLNASGTGVIWSTFFGGSAAQAGSFLTGDSISAMAVDASGNILIAGMASSSDLPGLWNTPVASRPAASNGVGGPGFIARLSPDGTTLSPTQLVNDFERGIATRADGSAIAVGSQVFQARLSSVGRVATICDNADEAKIVSVAPGQLVTLFGTNLAPEGSAPSANGYPTSFNGVTVTFNGVAAPILYTSGIQINLQVPYEIAGQTQVTMQVSSQFVTPAVSESYILAVANRQPSVFVQPGSFGQAIWDVANCNGQTIAGMQPVAFNADGSLNSCANPAAAGSTVTIFLNGLGVSSPAEPTGAISSSVMAINPAVMPVVTGILASALPTQTLPGSIASLAQVQVQAGSSTAVVNLEVADGSGSTFLVRGPGIVIWGKPAN